MDLCVGCQDSVRVARAMRFYRDCLGQTPMRKPGKSERPPLTVAERRRVVRKLVRDHSPSAVATVTGVGLPTVQGWAA